MRSPLRYAGENQRREIGRLHEGGLGRAVPMVASWPPAAIGDGFGCRRSGGLLLAMPGRSNRERRERRLLGARGRGSQKLRGGDFLNRNPRPKMRGKYLEGDPASLALARR